MAAGSGTNMSAITFVTFVRLKEVGEAAEFVGGYRSEPFQVRMVGALSGTNTCIPRVYS